VKHISHGVYFFSRWRASGSSGAEPSAAGGRQGRDAWRIARPGGVGSDWRETSGTGREHGQHLHRAAPARESPAPSRTQEQMGAGANGATPATPAARRRGESPDFMQSV